MGRKCVSPNPIATTQKLISNALEDRGIDPLFSTALVRGLRLVNNGLDTPCWIRGDDSSLYTNINFKGDRIAAHRFSYYIFTGNRLRNNGCHKCDTPACINPDHIFDGTQNANIKDAVNKNRMSNDVCRIGNLRKEVAINRELGNVVDLDEVSGVDRKWDTIPKRVEDAINR